jgi:adenine-specific DNA-methyltransferase
VVGKEAEDLSRHDKWLCMMYPRLKLLQKLLSNDGVIFVSIDDIEVQYLRDIMDEIFGKNKFIAQLIWKSRQNKDNRNITNVSVDHEYVLCYGEKLRGCERNSEQYKNPDNDPRGLWVSANMVGLATEAARPNLHYDLIDPQTGINYGKPAKGWRYDKKTMAQLIAENRILWPSTPNGRPRKKQFLNELSTEYTGYSSVVGNEFFTRDGTNELTQIFGKVCFDFPKNVGLISELVEQATDKDSIILDSFAGSGTTAHAVLFSKNQKVPSKKIEV